jgi:hypothetical protein
LYVDQSSVLMKAGSSKKSAMIGAAFMDKTVPNPKQ